MKVVMTHLTMEGVEIYSGGDLGHGAKKNRNSTRNSGTEGHSKELI